MSAFGVNSEYWLVQSIDQVDERAFESLYGQHYSFVYALALRLLCDEAKAEELVQEVFISVWRGLERFRGESSIRTWIHTITVRAAMRGWRRHSEERLTTPLIDRYERIAARTFPETRLALERAMATLPIGARTVLLLHDVYGHTHSEIAGILGVASGTVKAQLHRARNLMKRELQR